MVDHLPANYKKRTPDKKKRKMVQFYQTHKTEIMNLIK
jgi:hypothetical protein